MQLKTEGRRREAAGGGNFKNRDELYEAAVDIVVREGRGSVSLLQRALGIGYGRAARLIDFMAEDGIVGQYNGSQAREVLITLEDWEARTATARPLQRPGANGADNAKSGVEDDPARAPRRNATSSAPTTTTRARPLQWSWKTIRTTTTKNSTTTP